jgi:2-polyprenyl-3-methyl-5-hydroxy-6-metoxy-1,4-benzoquinol methylase
MAVSFPDFSVRAQDPEWMDDLALGGDTMRQTLDQLAVVNRYLGGGQAWRGVKALLGQAPPSSVPFTVADLGCGGGESLHQIAQWGRQAGVPLRLYGFDANPHVVAYARAKAASFPEISFAEADITSEAFAQQSFDVVTCSLVLHHFDNQTLPGLLKAYLAMSQRGLVISDLQRHWLPWSLFGLVSSLCGASPMIRHDGLLSVRRGFTRQELRDLLSAQGGPYQLQWRWAFRYLAVMPSLQT